MMSLVVVFSLDFPVFVLNQATQKNTCQVFLPNKIRESKISNPQKSLDHARHLKSGVPRSGAPDSDGRLGKRSKKFPIMQRAHIDAAYFKMADKVLTS